MRRIRVKVCRCGSMWYGGNEKYCPRGHAYRFDHVEFVAAPLDLEEAIKALPEEEQAAFRKCLESVVAARRSANANEGHTIMDGLDRG